MLALRAAAARLVLVLSTALLIAGPAAASTRYYAAPDGSGSSSDCTGPSTPCSLDNALSKAGATDIVKATDGVYAAPAAGYAVKPGVLMEGTSSKTTVIKGDAVSSGAVLNVGVGGQVQDVRVLAPSSDGVHWINGSYGTPSGNRIDVRAAGDACVIGGSPFELDDSLCMSSSSSSTAHGFSAPNGSGYTTLDFHNVTVVAEDQALWLPYAGSNAGQVNLVNTIIYPRATSASCPVRTPAFALALSHSAYPDPTSWSGCPLSSTVTQTAPVYARPLFTSPVSDPATADYHETKQSPTRGVGLIDASADAYDLDHRYRTTPAGTVDLGAYELFDDPVVTLHPAELVTSTAASVGATVNNQGGDSTSTFFLQAPVGPAKQLEDFYRDGAGIDQAFSTNVTGLVPGTTYAFWVCTSAGTFYGCSAHGSFVTKPSLPVVTRYYGVGIGGTAANVSNTVNSGNGIGTAHFEYGTTTAYGSVTPTTSVAASLEDQDVYAELSGLSPETTYHARAVVTNATGTTKGPDFAFKTIGSTILPPSPTPTPSATSVPTPVPTPAVRIPGGTPQNGPTPVALALSFHAPPTAKKGIVTALLDAPLAGPIRATLTYTVKTTSHGKTKTKVATYGTATVTATEVGTVTVTIKPSSAAKKVLKAKRKLTLTFSATLTPSTGKPLTATTLVGVKA